MGLDWPSKMVDADFFRQLGITSSRGSAKRVPCGLEEDAEVNQYMLRSSGRSMAIHM